MKSKILFSGVIFFVVIVVAFFGFSVSQNSQNGFSDTVNIPQATETQTPEPKNDIKLTNEQVVYVSPADYSRPEFCIRDGRAYATFRHSISGKMKNRAVNESALKVFDITPAGDFIDQTKTLFGADFKVLYAWDGEDGYMTDPQFVCDDDGFILAFEAGFTQNGEKRKRLAIHRFSDDFTLKKRVSLFETSGEIIESAYKADDPGIALLNNTLLAWVVSTPRGRIAADFALYGLNPDTLEIIADDGNNNPIFLKNIKQAPFSGVMTYAENQYHLFTSPKKPQGDAFDQDGLVEYRYDNDWKFVGMHEYSHFFGNDEPRYVTGAITLPEATLIGFLVQPSALSRSGSPSGTKVSPTQQYTNVGGAWVRIESSDEEVEYVWVSEKDGDRKADTRHTELAFSNNTLYVGYFYLTRPSISIIKRFSVEQK